MSDAHGTSTGANKDGTKGEAKVMKECSAEARTYHAYHDEVIWAPGLLTPELATNPPKLQRAHLRGHCTWCRDNCMNLLTEPRIPLWTHIQTLQLLSTMLELSRREQCLDESDQLIAILNPDKFQTQLLREDDRKMKSDTMVWRVKNDMVGKEVEGVSDEGHSDGQLELDSELDEKLKQKME